MPAPRYDIIGIGNAIVDVIARAEDDFLVAHGMHKGTMALIDEARAEKIYQAIPGARRRLDARRLWLRHRAGNARWFGHVNPA